MCCICICNLSYTHKWHIHIQHIDPSHVPRYVLFYLKPLPHHYPLITPSQILLLHSDSHLAYHQVMIWPFMHNLANIHNICKPHQTSKMGIWRLNSQQRYVKQLGHLINSKSKDLSLMSMKEPTLCGFFQLKDAFIKGAPPPGIWA